MGIADEFGAWKDEKDIAERSFYGADPDTQYTVQQVFKDTATANDPDNVQEHASIIDTAKEWLSAAPKFIVDQFTGRNVVTDIANKTEQWAKGAVAGGQEVLQENPYAFSQGEGLNEEQLALGQTDIANKAGANFYEETLKPAAFTAGLVKGIVAAPVMAGDLIKMIKEAPDTLTGIQTVAGEFSGYNAVKRNASNPSFFAKLNAEPVTTASELLPAFLVGKGVYSYAKGKVHPSDPAVKETVDAIVDADKTKQVNEALIETASKSKVLAEQPEIYEQIVADKLKDTPMETAYIAEETFNNYWTNLGIDPQGILTALGAKVTDGQVSMPYAKYLAVFGKSEHAKALADDVKFKDDGLTPNEAFETSVEVKNHYEPDLSPAHDLAEQGDYKGAYQEAIKAGDPTWAEVYRRMMEKQKEEPQQTKEEPQIKAEKPVEAKPQEPQPKEPVVEVKTEESVPLQQELKTWEQTPANIREKIEKATELANIHMPERGHTVEKTFQIYQDQVKKIGFNDALKLVDTTIEGLQKKIANPPKPRIIPHPTEGRYLIVDKNRYDKFETEGRIDDIAEYGRQNPYGYKRYYDTQEERWVQPGKRGAIKDKYNRPQYGEVPENPLELKPSGTFVKEQSRPDLKPSPTEQGALPSSTIPKKHQWMKEEYNGELDRVEKTINKELDSELNVDPNRGSIRIGNGRTAEATVETVHVSDPAIEARIQNAMKGVQKESLYERIKEGAKSVWHKASRVYEDLPNTAENAQLKFDLIKLQQQKDVAGDRVTTLLKGIVHKFDKGAMDLFTRKVVFDDLAQTKGDMPFGFTPETLAKAKSEVDIAVSKNSVVAKAIQTRKAIWDALKADYIVEMKAIGHDVSDMLTREDYFRRQVLDYANTRAIAGTGQKLKTPTGRGFLKQREGTELDHNANYLQAEFEVMAQMIYDTELAKTIHKIDGYENIRPMLEKRAKEQKVTNDAENTSLYGQKATAKQKMDLAEIDRAIKYPSNIGERSRLVAQRENLLKEVLGDEYKDVSWRSLIPEGYTTWQPREGSSFFMASAIPEHLATKLLSGIMEEIGVTPDMLHSVMAKGTPFKEFVVRKEVADTLNKVSELPSESPLGKLSRNLITPWKMWVLMSPTRMIKYNLRNVTGDGDALFTMNPRAFKEVPLATQELLQTIYGDKSMTPEMKDWYERGGMQSTSPIQELPQINRLREFERFSKGDGNILVRTFNKVASKDASVIKDTWISYWSTARTATQFREAIFRFACYKDYLKQMQENGGKPKNFGASKPEEVMALSSIEDRAFKLSNDVLGAYDNVSVLGKDLRTHLLPFWSWLETNFKRYTQFFKNQSADGTLGAAISRKLVGNVIIRSPYYAYKVGSFTLKAGVMWAGLQAYNNYVFPNEEAELPVEERARPHIILGRDEKGKVRYFNRLGAFSDFLEWFGLDTPIKDVKDFLDGSRNLKEIVTDMGKSPINKMANAIAPTIKIPAELASGKKFYPSVFNPKSIRDNPQYIADSLGLGNEFKAISKTDLAKSAGIEPRPNKPYLAQDTAENFVWYKAEPNQSSYYDIQEKKRKFLKEIGKGGDGDFSSPKSDALRNYKIALRLKDAETAGFYLAEYKRLGGDNKGLQKSLESLDPLSGISDKDRKKFKATLNGEEQKELEKANTYYKTVMLGK